MSELVRFGVAMERALLEDFDALVTLRDVTRSEILRDLVRAEVAKTQVQQGVPAVASLTLVYDHHVRDLTEKLTEMQHELGEQVTSTLHVHLNHDQCLEVIILRGQSDELQRIAERLLATRGVTQGGIQIVTQAGEKKGAGRRKKDAHAHGDAHGHAHGDAHDHEHPARAGGGRKKAVKKKG